MKLKNAFIGQRVVVKHIDPIGDIAKGQTGTIVDIDNSVFCPILVEFDEAFTDGLHGKDNRCYWLYPSQIKKEK